MCKNSQTIYSMKMYQFLECLTEATLRTNVLHLHVICFSSYIFKNKIVFFK